MDRSKCAYCARKATTVDHLPPKKIFAEPRTSDLITVPACARCNGGASEDDEYFIWNVIMSGKAVGSEAERSRQQRLDQGRLTPRRERAVKSILDRSQPVDVFTPAGLYLGRGMTCNVDRKRIDRVITRITRGLYFIEIGKRAAPNRVRAYSDPPIDDAFAETLRKVAACGERSVANGAFKYWFATAADRTDLAMVKMQFFNHFIAVGIVFEKKDLRRLPAIQS